MSRQVARAAYERGGAGKHRDRRTKRQRTRQSVIARLLSEVTAYEPCDCEWCVPCDCERCQEQQ